MGGTFLYNADIYIYYNEKMQNITLMLTTERLPLLLYGARQVGKTYVMQQLGGNTFKNTVYVNFEADQSIGKFFDADIHADAVIQLLEKYFHMRIVPGESLIIFDEIQMCERALTSLKYFAEQGLLNTEIPSTGWSARGL